MIVKASRPKILIYRVLRYFIFVNSFLFISKLILSAPMGSLFSVEHWWMSALMCIAISFVTTTRVQDRFDLTLNSDFISGPDYWERRKVFIKLDELVVANSMERLSPYTTQLLHSISNTPIRVTPYFYDGSELKAFTQELAKAKQNGNV